MKLPFDLHACITIDSSQDIREDADVDQRVTLSVIDICRGGKVTYELGVAAE